MASPRPEISILMPVYRLESSVAASIDRVAAIAPRLGNVEIIVCDDGSDDATASSAREAAARNAAPHIVAAVVVSHEINHGKGAALRTAFEASRGGIIVFLDGDLDLPPEQLPDFLSRFAALDVDGLVGAKRDAMTATEYPLVRRLLSNLYTVTVRILFRLPVTETQTGLKVFRRSALEQVMPALQVSRYTFDIELLVRMTKLGMRLAEAPVMLGPGAATTGLSAGTLVEMARDTMLVWVRSFRFPRSPD